MKVFLNRFMLFVGVLVCAVSVFAEEPHASVALVSEQSAVQPGKTLWLGIKFTIQKHWHVYWTNPGDSGIPPKVTWVLANGFRAGEPQWPIPQRIPTGPLMSFGYEDSLFLMVPVKVPANLHGRKSVDIKARVEWLVCNDVCVPEQGEVFLQLPVSKRGGGLSTDAGLFQEARAHLPKPLPAGSKVSALSSKDALALVIKSPIAERQEAITFFPFKSDQIENAVPQTVTLGDGKLQLVMKRSDQLSKVPVKFEGVLSVGEDGYVIHARFGHGAIMTQAHSMPMSLPQTSQSAPQGSLWQPLLFAFLGGLILNLMPCVFPVLSIKVLGLLQQKDEEKSVVRLHGLVYGLGVLLSFWALAGLLIALRAGGEHLGWGFQLQSPLFVSILGCFLFLMSLNLLGVFEVGTSLLSAGNLVVAKKGYTNSFLTGILATVVATPCTAPFMGTALGFAASQPAIIALLVFTALALGLALPYVVLCYTPAWGRFLPKPGRWMETLKQLMAFPLLATVIWLLWIVGLQAGIQAMTKLLAGFLVLAVAAWVYGRWQSKVAHLLAIILVVAALFWTVPRQSSGSQVMSLPSEGWAPYSQAKVDEAVKAGKPVFVDFSAAWCVTCKVNELVALDTDKVMSRMKELGVVLFKADWTNSDPEITKALAAFGRNGVPLYVLYTGKKDAAPVILPQVLTPQLVLSELEKIR